MIPFSQTTLGKEEKKAIADVIDSGWVVMGDKTKEFEEKFAEYVGAKYAMFVDSGTAALFLSVQYLKNLKLFQSNITVPSLTFVSTAEVIINSGLGLKFADINLNDFCLVSPLTASIGVNLAGNLCRSSSIIYDSAHRIEKDDLRGREKQLWCYSFYATKNITTIQGGMIATNDAEAAEWLKKARDHGLNLGTKERYEGQYKQYDVEFVGWRFKADDVRAAIGLEQLKKLPWITERRNEIVEKYNKAFGLNREGNHLYPILVEKRDEFMKYIYDAGIQSVVHFRPLHLMTAYKNYPKENLENTEYIGERIVSLPLFPQLKNEEIDYIINKILKSNLLIK